MFTFSNLKKSQFIRNIATLATGSLFAQVIPILASPVLTRLYTPEDFGLFAIFIAIVSTITPAVCGKYEVAMVLPSSDKQGMQLLGIAIRIALFVSFSFFFIILLFNQSILNIINAPAFSGWIFLTPFAVLFTGIMLAMNYYANRSHGYKVMAQVKIYQSILVVLINVVLGILGFGEAGLLLGTFSGLFFASVFLTYKYRKSLSLDTFKWNNKKAFLMKRYKDFPIYNATSAMLDGFRVATPIFFLTNYFPDSIVGFYALVIRVGTAPLAFVSASVSQINLKKVVDLVNRDQKVQPYLLRVTVGLVLMSLFPTIILFFFSEELFVILFGEKWRDAGVYMQILAPGLAVKFVASTLSSTLGATQNNQLGMIWKVTAFFVTIIVFMLFAPDGDIITLFYAIMIMDIVLYLFYYFIIWSVAGRPRNKIK